MALNLHPLSGSSLQNLFYLLKTYGFDHAYLTRLLPALFLSGCGEIERIRERCYLSKQLPKVEFEQEPVFILGHWRSGTTYLHHLMGQDPRFGYASSYQAWVPELFLRDNFLTRQMVLASLPKTRPMDNVELSIHKPEEEELAMAGSCNYSYIHSFFFPKSTREIFRKSVLFDGLSQKQYEHWKDSYLKVLKMAYLACDHRRLLLKSPANTARISTLLEMFPNAKFIHIYRDPYAVFTSKQHTCQKLIKLWGLQSISTSEVVDNVFYIYQEVMSRFLESYCEIPEGNLIEISYEELERRPFETVANVYDVLGIPGFESVSGRLRSYIESTQKYCKNTYEIEPYLKARITEEWGFALEHWGYASLNSLDGSFA